MLLDVDARSTCTIGCFLLTITSWSLRSLDFNDMTQENNMAHQNTEQGQNNKGCLPHHTAAGPHLQHPQSARHNHHPG